MRGPGRLIASLCLVGMLGLSGQAVAAPLSAAGIWQQYDEDGGEPQALVTLTEQDGIVEGTVTKLFPAPGEPADPVCGNCKGAKRGKPVLGMKVIERVKRGADGFYSGGIIIDPESGTEYNCQLSLSDNGKILKVRGFVGVSLFGRTQEWKRLQ